MPERQHHSGVCYSGFSQLVVMDSRLNGNTYAEILSIHSVGLMRKGLGSDPCHWVDDNCPAHRSQLVQEWFRCCNALYGINLTLLTLPAYSPDNNSIENAWGLAKYSLLYTEIKKNSGWAEIQGIKSFARDRLRLWLLSYSLSDRLDRVIRNDGYPIRY